jgi:hypothetical protein
VGNGARTESREEEPLEQAAFLRPPGGYQRNQNRRENKRAADIVCCVVLVARDSNLGRKGGGCLVEVRWERSDCVRTGFGSHSGLRGGQMRCLCRRNRPGGGGGGAYENRG